MANLWNAADDGALETNRSTADVAFAPAPAAGRAGTDGGSALQNPLAWAPAGAGGAGAAPSSGPGTAAPRPFAPASSPTAAAATSMADLLSPIDDDGNPILQVINRERTPGAATPAAPAGDVAPLWHRGDDDLLPSGGRTSRRFRLRLR